MNKIIIGVTVIIIIISIVILLRESPMQVQDGSPPYQSSNSTTTDLLIVSPPQNDTFDKVFVSSVTMPEPGYVVVREVDDERLGQIVEISEYLTSGTHQNVVVTLGSEYTSAGKLIVMLYGDSGNDKIMNDLDRPLRTENNLPIARYVSSGKSVPTDILANGFQAEAKAMMEMGQSMPDMAIPMQTIRFTNKGYVPANITIKAGTMVMFINESDQDMWVASNGHPAHTDLPTFDQFEFSAKGGQYVYTFDQAGSWKYHDHIAPIFGGVISVTE